MDVEIGGKNSTMRTKIVILPADLANILDSIVFLYHTAVHHTLSMSRTYFSTLNQFSKSLIDTQSKLSIIDADHSDVIAELELSRQVCILAPNTSICLLLIELIRCLRRNVLRLHKW